MEERQPNRWIRVYRARDIADAHLLREYLRARGIDALVEGESTEGGDAPVLNVPGITPIVCAAAEHVDRVRQAMADYLHIDHTNCIHCGYNLTGLTEPRCPECGEFFMRMTEPVRKESWQCPQCGEWLEPQFTHCWRCAGSDIE